MLLSTGLLFNFNMNKKSINNINCCVYGCHTKKGRENHLSFHKFPQANASFVYIINKFGTQEKVDRKKAWKIKLLTTKCTPYMKVCSLHFMENDFILPGFDCKLRRLKSNAVPSQNLPVKSIPDVPRYRPSPRVRINPMSLRKQPKLEAYSFVEPSSSNDNFINSRQVKLSEDEKIAVESLLNIAQISCTIRNIGTQVKSGDIITPFASVIDTDKKLSSLTGLQSFAMLNILVELIVAKFPCKRVTKLSIKERVILTFMKLKLGLRYVVLAALFGTVTSKTCKVIFEETISKLAVLLRPVIIWPSLEECKRNTPNCFSSFPNVRVVLDCTEVKLQRPKCLCCRIVTYSHYKGDHTIKLMTGVSPAGVITFVSKAYGGKASDNAIFAQSGLIHKLEMGRDSIMVDKGFRIDDITSKHYIKLVRPPFLRNKVQFTEAEAKQNVEIARARVHIERANQRIKVFEIFNKSFPIALLHKIDDIFIVVCAIVNLSPPILSDNKFLQ